MSLPWSDMTRVCVIPLAFPMHPYPENRTGGRENWSTPIDLASAQTWSTGPSDDRTRRSDRSPDRSTGPVDLTRRTDWTAVPVKPGVHTNDFAPIHRRRALKLGHASLATVFRPGRLTFQQIPQENLESPLLR